MLSFLITHPRAAKPCAPSRVHILIRIIYRCCKREQTAGAAIHTRLSTCRAPNTSSSPSPHPHPAKSHTADGNPLAH